MKNSQKKYILDMFPYPSGDGLHVGHVLSYTATDILSRYYKMRGYEVLHPQGWDAFGLPAENFAIKTGVHPSQTTKKAIAKFKEQMKMLDFDYDWDREINSSDPKYYKWTQWMFLQLYKNGLAYKKKARVNWCTKCKTVLANEQAEGGKCERCESEVIQKELEQWFFKITDFADDLIKDLYNVDWPESTKLAQKNWIGKSEGAIVKFQIISNKKQINFKTQALKQEVEIFTTRPDTLFGATYFVLSPEHPLVQKITTTEQKKEIENYIKEASKKTTLERTEIEKEKTGVFTGAFAINPVNKEKIPVWIADYVMMEYGTGAIMAVPAHDERDFEFAKKYKLPIKKVVLPPALSSVPRNANDIAMGLKPEMRIESECYIGDGENVNSDFLNGLSTSKAKEKMIQWLEKNKFGKKAVNYKLRDWLISRQRYWGAPIPIIYCEKCGIVPVPEKDLPVKLPTDVDFNPTGESPLVNSKEFHNVKCPKCGGKARRESDTMDTFVCSSWYYLRYADPKNDKEFASKKALEKWLPVDVYVGGAEHSVLHLLYSRFFIKALKKFGYLNFSEPFLKLRHQGTILAPDGQKMSKSKGNVINPDNIIKEYGADTLRMYEMFLGPLEDVKPWDTKGIIGIKRFLNFFNDIHEFYFKWIKGNKEFFEGWLNQNEKETSENVNILLNKTIKKVGEDIENFKFNTAISQLMILKNDFFESLESSERKSGNFIKFIFKKDFETYLKLLAPFAPFITEKIWKDIGHDDSIFDQPWPEYKKELIEEEKVTLIIQINGKLRDKIEVEKNTPQKEIEVLALNKEKIKKYIVNKKIKKIIFVENRLINIVI